MKNYLWLFLVLFLSIPVFVVSFTHRTALGAAENGILISGIEALDSLLEVSRGKPVLMNFWATWCGPCVRELPVLEELAIQYQNEVVFLAIDIGDPEFSTLELFRENKAIGITVAWLSVEEADLFSERLLLPDVLPITLVFDSELNEVSRAIGARTHDWFVSALDGAISEISEIVVEDVDAGLDIHIYVVGPSNNEIVDILVEEAILIAGENGYDVLDPSVPADSIAIEAAYLPSSGWPYAQLCVGGACNRPVNTPEELRAAFERMR